ncbi:hypothetical protein BKA67DRAFT_666248 [Truncatella angustata]|uniref:Uncharacterized protein n=1 Tax=Truncatella angustata TaxID=152316 RepID=A0A9P9A409_9PEZI|nr:uncharacterized protein BKA67DRAFT_666248 [Truncatella angustata]KAH6659434.1 hypothetical protein BKA67DRAFT_666248 [Truncatella angustata]
MRLIPAVTFCAASHALGVPRQSSSDELYGIAGQQIPPEVSSAPGQVCYTYTRSYLTTYITTILATSPSNGGGQNSQIGPSTENAGNGAFYGTAGFAGDNVPGYGTDAGS